MPPFASRGAICFVIPSNPRLNELPAALENNAVKAVFGR